MSLQGKNLGTVARVDSGAGIGNGSGYPEQSQGYAIHVTSNCQGSSDGRSKGELLAVDDGG